MAGAPRQRRSPLRLATSASWTRRARSAARRGRRDLHAPAQAPGPTYDYIGSPPAKTTPDGFTSVGDLGWVDEEGYLFLADRRIDLIITGGANVYPAEVEAALTEHPGIADVAVIGVPDEDWGKRVHAIVQPRDPVAPADRRRPGRPLPRAADRLQGSQDLRVRRIFRRTEAGKLRRSALVDERESGWVPGMVAVGR